MPILLRRCSALHPSNCHFKISSIYRRPTWSHSSTKVQTPPFYVSEGYEFSTLKNALFDITESSSILFKSTPKYLIMHAGTVVAWNTIFKFLADNEQFKFHTHLPKPLKPYSVFIRHLHPSTPVEDIQAYITDRGYAVIQVTNILHRINKNALPLFRIDLKPATNNSDILNLDSLLHTKIKIELPKKKRALLNAIIMPFHYFSNVAEYLKQNTNSKLYCLYLNPKLEKMYGNRFNPMTISFH
ncbi:hypothetical protein QTP88_027596 [Uroleucon formosanum]